MGRRIATIVFFTIAIPVLSFALMTKNTNTY